MELAAWLLTFATAAALLYAVTRALAFAFRVAVAVLVVAAVIVGIQAYGRGERWDRATREISQTVKSAEVALTKTWNGVRPWLKSEEEAESKKRRP